MNTQGKIYTVLFTFIISFLFVFVLALVFELSKERIADNKRADRIKAVLNAFGISYSDTRSALETYKNRVQSDEETGFYTTQKQGKTFYAVEFRGRGLWGAITGILAVNENVTQVEGMEIISQAETPGLGGKIGEPVFKSQFRGKRLNPGGQLSYTRPGPAEPGGRSGEVDAITGATATSTLFLAIINDALIKLKTKKGGDS